MTTHQHLCICAIALALAVESATCQTNIPPVPNAVDLRPAFTRWGLAPRVQGKRGTCSVFTLAGALEFAAARKLERGGRFSVEFLNWSSDQVLNYPKDGGFFSDLWKGFAAYGICTEQEMPYQSKFDPSNAPTASVRSNARTNLALGLQLHWIKRWNVRTGLKEEQFREIKRTLAKGWPVCGGFRWPNREKWESGVLQICPTNAVFDGHSVLLVGFRDDSAQAGGGVFVFRNSGGSGRDGLMPYAYTQAFMNDALWIDPRD